MGGEEFAYIVNHYDPELSQIYYLDKTGINSLQLSFDSNSTIEINYYMVCPQVYVFNGQGYEKIGEIITENIYQKNEGEDTLLIPNHFIKDSKLRIRIDENLDEISFLNFIELFAGDFKLKPINCVPELNHKDDKYLILHKNDFYDLEFIIDVPEEQIIKLKCRGYYIYY